jgi:hypothetical protein
MDLMTAQSTRIVFNLGQPTRNAERARTNTRSI